MGTIIDCRTGQESAFTPPQPAIPARKAILRELVMAKALAVSVGGITANGSTFASDPVSRNELMEAALAAALAQIDNEAFSADIELLNGNVVTLTRPQTRGLAKAFRTHTAAVRANARALIQAINAASSHAQLDAIDLSAGWP